MRDEDNLASDGEFDHSASRTKTHDHDIPRRQGDWNVAELDRFEETDRGQLPLRRHREELHPIVQWVAVDERRHGDVGETGPLHHVPRAGFGEKLQMLDIVDRGFFAHEPGGVSAAVVADEE